jgi:short chain dehydrogenase
MSAVSAYSLPWYKFLSIDLLLRVALNSFLHPVLCWLYPLSLRAQAFRLHMAPLRHAILFAVLVDLFWLLHTLNRQARNGRFSPRGPIVHHDGGEEEVVVITGASSGLGQILAEMFALKGVSVAVLDVVKPQMEGNYALEYYECDVSKWEEVESTLRRVSEEVCSPPPPRGRR